ncbi:hypothetical protein ACQEVZ_09190 [Dactylosporangium sp. CA-152071]|uniref:hypothetical protein n=1 Tax=Dactylosporangium sp. CA-152071 TaxID=3239933 RepID=UPI003D8E34A1
MFNPLEHPGLPVGRQGRHWHELDVEATQLRSAEPGASGRVDEMEALQAAAALFNRRAALRCPDLESQRAVQRLGLAATARHDTLAALHPFAGAALSPGGDQSLWAQLVVQECAACAMYHTFLEQETDRRLRQLWELHLQMELAALHTAGDLLRLHEDRDPQELMAAMPAAGVADLPAMLTEHQSRIDEQFDRTAAAAGEDRYTAFGELAWMIAVHETIEEEIVHPLTRHLDPPDHLADHLLDEERRISEALADVSIGLGDVDGLAAVHAMLLAHTRRESTEEFPLLRAGIPAAELADLATAARAAESQACAGATARPGMPQASDLVRDVLRPTAQQLPV